MVYSDFLHFSDQNIYFKDWAIWISLDGCEIGADVDAPGLCRVGVGRISCLFEAGDDCGVVDAGKGDAAVESPRSGTAK